MSNLITPHAAFLIWNYIDRKGANLIESTKEIDRLIISTLSIKSISTTKNKATVNGTFEVRLAPTKNWVQVITPGSWCTILMSRSKIEKSDVSETGKAHKNKIKFFGRIDSVRVSMSIDQNTGARVTEYIVTGVDWAGVFNSTLYIDPALAQSIKGSEGKGNTGSIGYLAQLIYRQQLNLNLAGMPSTATNLHVLLSIWGSKALGDKDKERLEKIQMIKDLVVQPEIKFSIPTEVLSYFNFSDKNGGKITSNTIVDILQMYHGCLNKLGQDEYSDSYDNVEESFGVIQGEDAIGQHVMWSVMNIVSNTTINDLICDLRWQDDKPSLALYKRIKPFIVNKDRITRDAYSVSDKKSANIKSINTYVSEFKNLRRVRIPLSDVIDFNAGTNWGDKVNFIEVKSTDPSFIDIANTVRMESQFYDAKSFSREGLRPYIPVMRHAPKDFMDTLRTNEKKADNNKVTKKEDQSIGESKKPNKNKNNQVKNYYPLTEMKYIFKEWYFDVHKMLNGSITFFGQDKYIQVGDNIIVDATVAGYSQNITDAQIVNKNNAFLLAHVENVSNSFTIDDETGARHFITNVAFVRGIIVNSNGEMLNKDEENGQLNQDVSTISGSNENNVNVIASKTMMDVENGS